MVFGFFRKKPPSLMDVVTSIAYGDRPSRKSVNLSEAIEIAHGRLCGSIVKVDEVRSLAASLFDGPMPYSTLDLAVATAMNLYRHAEKDRRQALAAVQGAAAVDVMNWLAQKKEINILIAQTFLNSLQELYGDVEIIVHERQGETTRYELAVANPVNDASAPNLNQAAEAYYLAAVDKADEMFSASWPLIRLGYARRSGSGSGARRSASAV